MFYLNIAWGILNADKNHLHRNHLTLSHLGFFSRWCFSWAARSHQSQGIPCFPCELPTHPLWRIPSKEWSWRVCLLSYTPSSFLIVGLAVSTEWGTMNTYACTYANSCTITGDNKREQHSHPSQDHVIKSGLFIPNGTTDLAYLAPDSIHSNLLDPIMWKTRHKKTHQNRNMIFKAKVRIWYQTWRVGDIITTVKQKNHSVLSSTLIMADLAP